MGQEKGGIKKNDTQSKGREFSSESHFRDEQKMVTKRQMRTIITVIRQWTDKLLPPISKRP